MKCTWSYASVEGGLRGSPDVLIGRSSGERETCHWCPDELHRSGGRMFRGETKRPLYRNVFRRQGSWSVTLRLAKSSINVAPLASMELSWRNCNKPAHACAEGRSAEMTIKKYRNFGDAVAGDSLSTLVRASLAIVLLSHFSYSPYRIYNQGKITANMSFSHTISALYLLFI
jgi:hypothetical protein